ncbi:MAG: glycosyltransferase family 4 protein [Gammaproteobacteria bacterium]|nr:glycosyltransferase family 4 protein [Gammaproteobacteria bacterium]
MLIVTTQCFPPAMGGIESLIYHLAHEIGRMGQEVVVYADAGSGNEKSWSDTEQSFQAIRFGGLKPIRRRTKAKNIKLKLQSQTKNPPVILADTWKSLEFLDTCLSTRTVCLAHGSELPQQPSRQKLNRISKAFAKADIIIANSNYTASRLAVYAHNKHIDIIHPGIDIPVQDKSSNDDVLSMIGKKSPVLITIARLEKRKGHHRVIDLLPKLIKDFPDLVYIIIGDGPLRSNLEAQVNQYALQDHVRFIGPLTGPMKSAFLNNSDIFVMPGIQVGDDIEGYGIAYVEAAYFGVPGVASKLGGVVDAVTHGKTGLVCAPADTDCLEDSLRSLITDSNYRDQLGEDARKLARESLWNNRIKDYTKLLFKS